MTDITDPAALKKSQSAHRQLGFFVGQIVYTIYVVLISEFNKEDYSDVPKLWQLAGLTIPFAFAYYGGVRAARIPLPELSKPGVFGAVQGGIFIFVLADLLFVGLAKRILPPIQTREFLIGRLPQSLWPGLSAPEIPPNFNHLMVSYTPRRSHDRVPGLFPILISPVT